MNYQKINEILGILDDKKPRYMTLLSSNQSSDYYKEKNQGEEGLKVDIYDIDEQDIFLKVCYSSDSYGCGEKITAISFVTKQTKEITIYE